MASFSQSSCEEAVTLFLFSRRGSYRKNTPLSLDTDLRETSVFRLHPVAQEPVMTPHKKIPHGPEQRHLASAPPTRAVALKKRKNPLVLGLPKWDRKSKENFAHVDFEI